MVQNRLLSSNPAEANTSFWIFASWARTGVAVAPKRDSSITSNPRGATPRNEGRKDPLRLIEHLLFGAGAPREPPSLLLVWMVPGPPVIAGPRPESRDGGHPGRPDTPLTHRGDVNAFDGR